MKNVYTLPDGTISLNDVNIELARPSGQSINLNDGEVRRLAGKPEGTISMADLRGKSNAVVVTCGYIDYSEQSRYGYNTANAIQGDSWGSVSQTAFGAGQLYSAHSLIGSVIRFNIIIGGADYGDSLGINLDGTVYTLPRQTTSGDQHLYILDDEALARKIMELGKTGGSFTIYKT